MRPLLDRTERVLTRIAEGPPLLAMALLGVLMLAVLSPMIASIPPIDRDEVLFAQASRQMAESGDMVDIRFAEGVRYKKPIGIYWIQSTSARLFGGEELGRMWIYRLPSLLAAIGSVLLTYVIGLILFDRRQAFLGALLLGSTLVLAAEARLAKTDAWLLFTILMAQMPLARAWVTDARLNLGMTALLWGALGVSVLIKGPIGLMVIGLTVVGASLAGGGFQWVSRLRPWLGIGVLVAVVVPWYIAITLTSGSAFWEESLGRDLLGKVSDGQESHGAPPGTYLAAMWLTFWPAVILLPAALAAVWRTWSHPAVLFCLAWIIPTWIVFELVATKLVHYVLPTYPALALLVAYGWNARARRGYGVIWTGSILALAALGVVYVAVPVAWSLTIGVGPSLAYLLGVLIVGIALYGLAVALRARMDFTPVLLFPVLSLGIAVSLFGHGSRIDYLWPAQTIAALERPCPNAEIRVIGFSEPSLVFQTGDWTIDNGLDSLTTDCALIVIEGRVMQETTEALVSGGWSLRERTPFEALDLGKGRPMILTPFDARRDRSE